MDDQALWVEHELWRVMEAVELKLIRASEIILKRPLGGRYDGALTPLNRAYDEVRLTLDAMREAKHRARPGRPPEEGAGQ